MSSILFRSPLWVYCAVVAFHLPAIGQSPGDATVDESTSSDKAYLGLQLSPVPELLAIHLPNILPSDGGLLILGVSADSPAARDGLEKNDILVRFDGKQVTDYEQLIEYISGCQPEQTVELTVIRRGKPLGVKVTLGQRPPDLVFDRPLRRWPSVPGLPAMPDFDTGDDARARRDMQEHLERVNKMLEEMGQRFGKGRGGTLNKPPIPQIDPDALPSSPQSSSSTKFVSININKTGEDQYTVVVKYKAEDGQLRELHVVGTAEDVRKAAEQDEKMPANVRQQLLRGIGGGKQPPKRPTKDASLQPL